MKKRICCLAAAVLLTLHCASAGAATYGTLEYGDRGGEVMQMQEALIALGYLHDEADGKFGLLTQAAVCDFQRQNGLTADGKAGSITLTLLYKLSGGSTPSTGTDADYSTGDIFGGNYATLEYGDRGERVILLQNALNRAGFDAGKADGQFGSGTRNAVAAFQKQYKLDVDGKAGRQTLTKLKSVLAEHNIADSDNSASSGGAASSDVPTRTLYKGDTGNDVMAVQKRLLELGYYAGLVDGTYGAGTAAAVTAFQTINGLTADGIAGPQTCGILFSDDAKPASEGGSGNTSADGTEGVEIVIPEGGYVTLHSGDAGQQVTQLQTVLKNLHYSIEVTGTYDSQTVTAVRLFQRLNGLDIDGVAGKDTQTVLYSGSCVPGDVDLSYATAANAAPDGSDVQLLHWFNDIRDYLKNNKVFTVYDPATGLSWKMQLYSPGNHADSEPLTAADSAIMYKAFDDQWTWSQRAVYVQLANGSWCIAAMPNMPHLSGGIDDNDFDGHTCVHFPRTMTECAQNDPNYGVSVQETIRDHWKKLTGEDIPW